MTGAEGADASPQEGGRTADLRRGLARAAAAALLFSLPVLLTAETWTIGHVTSPGRLALLLALLPVLLVRIGSLVGFRSTRRLRDDVADAFVAIAVATLVALAVLVGLQVVTPATDPVDLVAKLIVQIVPGSVGAALARSQLGSKDMEEEAHEHHGSLGAAGLVMLVGAMVLMMPIVTTAEVVRLAHATGAAGQLGIALATLGAMQVIVHSLKATDEAPGRDAGGWRFLLCYTLPGYAIVLVAAAFFLWASGRLDGLSWQAAQGLVAILALPGGLGAAFARLLV